MKKLIFAAVTLLAFNSNAVAFDIGSQEREAESKQCAFVSFKNNECTCKKKTSEGWVDFSAGKARNEKACRKKCKNCGDKPKPKPIGDLG